MPLIFQLTMLAHKYFRLTTLAWWPFIFNKMEFPWFKVRSSFSYHQDIYIYQINNNNHNQFVTSDKGYFL